MTGADRAEPGQSPILVGREGAVAAITDGSRVVVLRGAGPAFCEPDFRGR